MRTEHSTAHRGQGRSVVGVHSLPLPLPLFLCLPYRQVPLPPALSSAGNLWVAVVAPVTPIVKLLRYKALRVGAASVKLRVTKAFTYSSIPCIRSVCHCRYTTLSQSGHGLGHTNFGTALVLRHKWHVRVVAVALCPVSPCEHIAVPPPPLGDIDHPSDAAR